MSDKYQEDYDLAVDKIDQATEDDGPYSNNVVGSVLRAFSEKYGFEKANLLIDECNITHNHGIEKVIK